MTMDIIIMAMDMGTITINHRKVTTQTCPRNLLSGHEKAMLSEIVQHGFFICMFSWSNVLLLLCFEYPFQHTR